jgi:hypothetical protein
MSDNDVIRAVNNLNLGLDMGGVVKGQGMVPE